MASLSPPKSLIFDLEVAPGKADQPERIFMVGALRPDIGEDLERRVEGDLGQVLEALDTLGEGASFVLGHNVIQHDLPTLKRQAPQLALHQLPNAHAADGPPTRSARYPATAFASVDKPSGGPASAAGPHGPSNNRRHLDCGAAPG